MTVDAFNQIAITALSFAMVYLGYMVGRLSARVDTLERALAARAAKDKAA